MDLKLNRRKQLPIHIQLKAQLIYLIQTGQLSVGTQLPTVRQLAGFLRVNRNTVSKVFSDLEREGYLSCEPGRGTFVSTKKVGDRMRMEKMQKLLMVVDEAIDKAKQLGFGPEDFSLTLYARTQTAAEPARLPKVPILFVECNQPQTKLFSEELKNALSLPVDSMLVKVLQRIVKHNPESLRKYSLVVTTFYHVHELQALLAKIGVEVVGLLVETNLEILMRLMSLPEGTKVGIACNDWTGTQNMKLSIENAGLKHLRLVLACGEEKESINKMLKETSVIFCCKGVEEKIRSMASEGKEIIVDDRRIAQAGIEMLRVRLRGISAKEGIWNRPKAQR
jgi:DNA-binding transcriptional regulator YhcF (GntR family)